jgi:hypothetical protein
MYQMRERLKRMSKEKAIHEGWSQLEWEETKAFLDAMLAKYIVPEGTGETEKP